MNTTPFPGRPVDVVPLTIVEFTVALDLTRSPSLDEICGRFPGDANRAIVWLIRFRALKSLTDDAEICSWLAGDAGSTRDACDVAASLRLTERWEFDRRLFRSAVTELIEKRG